MSQLNHGFTVIEIVALIVLIMFASLVAWVEKNNFDTVIRDDKTKIALNAMHYALQKIYYPEHKSYPREINAEVLPTVGPSLFDYEYSYMPTDCDNNQCQNYVLRASLSEEADYVKTN